MPDRGLVRQSLEKTTYSPPPQDPHSAWVVLLPLFAVTIASPSSSVLLHLVGELWISQGDSQPDSSHPWMPGREQRRLGTLGVPCHNLL